MNVKLKYASILILLFSFLPFFVNAQLDEAFDFTLVDTENDTFNLYNVLDQGYFVLIDCHGIWCAPCRSSIPSLKHYWDKYNGDNNCFYIFGLNTTGNESSEQVSQYKTDSLIEFPMFAMDSNEHRPWSICEDLGGTISIPQFFLINPNRSIEYYRLGGIGDIDSQYSQQLDSVIGSFLEGTFCWKLHSPDISSDISIDIVPNPFHNSFFLAASLQKRSIIHINIYNAFFELVFETHFYSDFINREIVISNKPNGIYFLNISIDGFQYVEKLVKY